MGIAAPHTMREAYAVHTRGLSGTKHVYWGVLCCTFEIAWTLARPLP